MKKPKVVVIGGGTGTFTVLTGLKKHPIELSAIVATMDDGGSSGRLRDEFGILPPGDVRRCLLALASEDLDSLFLRQLFEYRFNQGAGLSGHSFGNLFLTALSDILKSEEKAIEVAGKILKTSGRVLPVTTDNVKLCARLEDGTIIKGETNIDIRRVRPDLSILDIFLDREAEIHKEAKEAIKKADLIILGPGDLYTSILPNFLVLGVNKAISISKAKLFYIVNLMTKYGETDGFAASDFIKEVKKYLGQAARKLTAVFISKEDKPSKGLLEKYKQEKAFPVKVDLESCWKLAPKIVVDSFASEKTLFRHDPKKLAQAILAELN